jgi:4-amino-4-deoxy-L-arabinose transferase-like glycosyltransferase
MASFFSCAPTLRLLWYALILKLGVMSLLIFYGNIGLGPDEAQYWTWSQQLDWGYYSKPPGIAWQIWLGTQLFGSTEWGVRCFSLCLSLFQTLLTYHFAIRMGLQARTAFWCGLSMALCPLGFLGSLLAITDGGFLLCWTGACLTVASALHQQRVPHPFIVGGWILAGALFKWPIYLFWLFFIYCRFHYFRTLPWSQLLGGLFMSLLGLLPSIWWNRSHDWATFRHVFTTLQGGNAPQTSGNPIGFLGAQVALISPVLFVLLILGLLHGWRKRRSLPPPLFFCWCVTVISLAVLSLLACFQKIQGNWALFAYPTGFMILGWDVCEQTLSRVRWLKIGLALSAILTLAIHLFPFLLPYSMNPLKHHLGWLGLPDILTKQGYQSDQHFLFSDRYQTTSVLSFYAPGQKRAYFMNLQGIRKNQFSYWPNLEQERQGQTGFFVWVETMPDLKREWKAKWESYQVKLKEYFEDVEFLGVSPLIVEGATIVKAVFIFRCVRCKHVPPIDPSLY